MAFIPAPGVCRSTLVYNQDGQEVVNVLNFTGPLGFDINDMVDLGGGLSEYWTGNVMPSLSVDCQLLRVELRDQRTNPGLSTDIVLIPSFPGGNPSQANDNSQTLVVKAGTQLAGRSYRGRVYFPGIPSGSIVDNRVSTILVNELVTALNGMVGAGAIFSGWTWCVTSYYTNGVARANAVSTPVLSCVATSTVVASQRRRKPQRS